jgi:hypothetical protein
VRVLVTLTRPGVTREVDWQVFVVNRCGGRRTPTAAGSITVPAASDHGSVLTQVPVPEGVQALVAVTTDPAHAAAKALPLPGTGSAC